MQGIKGKINYINQLDYTDLPYPTTLEKGTSLQPPYPTVAEAGCGLVSACMLIEGLAGIVLTVPEAVAFSVEMGANQFGTNMLCFGQAIADRYGLSFEAVDSMESLLACLDEGGMAILNVGKSKGLFSDGGHFILAVKRTGQEVYILDPSATKEKYSAPYRKGLSRMEYPYVIAAEQTVQEQIANRSPACYLFWNKGEDFNP